MLNCELCGELVVRCFQARTDTHVAHLLTKSYAVHVALHDFYDEIVDLADAFAEAAQGRGSLLKYPRITPRSSEVDIQKPLTIVEGLRTWIDGARDTCCDDTELQNLIDEIISLCSATVYKLRFLA